MNALSLGVQPELVWGLFTRGIGLLYLISFLSLAGQIVLGCGREGGLPVAPRLARIASDFPTWRRFYYFPTLLWLNRSDAMLRALVWIGALAAVAMIYGGPYSFHALLTCYLCYLSLDLATGLIFPWDCLLFEATVLGLFLPPTHALPALAAVSAPAPALVWAYRLLLFRVMFGFGKQKFMGATNKDWAYLKGFLIAQPLPSWLGWYAQKLPDAMLKLLVLAMFLTEIPIPFLALFPGWPSILCAVATAGLMVGIQVMGSFGYFSMLTIVGCIPLLDNETPRLLQLSGLFASGAPILTNAYVLLHTLAAVCAFPFNSWVGQSWHLWSVWYRLPRLAQLPLDFFRLLHPFRWLHPYGVFPPNTGPSAKGSLLVEVSWDRKTWHECEFHYSPSRPSSKPRFVSPYHPRGDQAVIYETFGLNPTSLISSTLGPWDPYSFGAQPAATVLLQRICEGHGLDFMKDTALKEHKEPPVIARISTILLEPASLEEHRKTGNWWKRTYIGPHTPPCELDPHFWQELLPEPEMWHFDAIFWRKRCPKTRALMERSLAGKDDPLSLVLLGAPELTAEDVRRFWDELVPYVGLEQRKDFETLPDVVPEVRRRFDRKQLRALHRLLGRFSMLLVARLEPMYLGRYKNPALPAKTYFHLWMAAQHIIGNGKDAFLAAMADPPSVSKALSELTAQTGIYYMTIFRYESIVFEAQKMRLVTAITPPHDPAAKAKFLRGEGMTSFEQTIVRLSESFSGYFSVMPHLRPTFIGPRFDHGFPEMYPEFKQLESGEVVVSRYAELPAGRELPEFARK